MPRWTSLPSGLPEKDRQLIIQLRRLKDHSGLGLAALAAKTGYSRSSWERYLNGKQPVPRKAVEELAKVCGTDPTKLLVLHEVAERQPPEPAAEEAAAGTGAEGADADEHVDEPPGTRESGAPDSGARPSGRRRVPLRYALAGAIAAAAVAFAAGLLVAGGGDGGGGDGDTKPLTYGPGRTYDCDDTGRKDGAAYAGHSTTAEALIALNGNGPDVVEAQCLLKRHGFDPGEIDGLYGPGAKSAVQEFQKARKLVSDGIVGPDTWAELRR
ncbi:peptidoglycan-binding protein [Streptomyces scopuliridis]|uniref:Peptidoglycan-binding protein n=1 Tax=Streptomyces scopuliridis TaxID=452529 RepID=A0ACD4ZKB3_9ACTN|nr:peptidoglycan-binding protein [Streptomyces scopuliridis]WSB98227.1 peptidoglycan-binding protein [Streptomyces scopuliridis]WSC08071.1 peptidoglycan-binding protein [Streptomyces scopuliridis]